MASRDDSARAGRYDDEVKVLTTQISFLEEEIAALRRRLADSPRQTRLLEERLREAETNLASITGQNERLAGNPARGTGPDRGAEGGGRPAGAAAVRLRDLPAGLRGRQRGRVHRRPEDAGQRQPGGRAQRAAARPGGRAQRGAQRGHRPGLRDDRRGRHAQGDPRGRRPGAGDLPRRRGADRAAGRAAAPVHAARRRLAAARAAVRLRVRADTQGRGRRADPGGSAGHHLLARSAAWRRRSSRSATRSSCPTCTRTCSRSTSSSRRRACCCTARPAAARP